MAPGSGGESWLATFIKTAARNSTLDMLFGGSQSIFGMILEAGLRLAFGSAGLVVPAISITSWFGKNVIETQMERFQAQPIGAAYNITKSKSGLLRAELSNNSTLDRFPIFLPETYEMPIESLWDPIPVDRNIDFESLQTIPPIDVYQSLGVLSMYNTIILPRILSQTERSPNSQIFPAVKCSECGSYLPIHSSRCTQNPDKTKDGYDPSFIPDVKKCSECGFYLPIHSPTCSKRHN